MACGRWRTAALALLACGAVLVPGCGRPLAGAGRHGGVGAGGPGRAQRTITVAVASDFPTLDPARAADTESVSAVQLMYEPLFSYAGTGRLVGRLAVSWTWSDGGRRLTVRLDPRARFADGAPVTAADVAFSLARMLRAGSGAPEALSFADLVGFAQLRAGRPWLATGIQQRGNRTVVFRLSRPLPYLPELLALPSASVVEARVVAGAGSAAASSEWWFEHSAGSGPYVLDRLVPGQELVLRPNWHYWRRGTRVNGLPVGPFAAVRFVVVPSPQDQLAGFRDGQIDVLDPLSPAQSAAVGAPPSGARLFEASTLGIAYLGFNTSRPPFDRREARLAVAYALDKQALLAAAGGQGQLAAGLLPPDLPGYDPALRPYPYDPARARQLLAAGGVAPGQPVTLLTIAAGGTVQAGSDAVAQLVAEELDAVGLDVTVHAVSWQAYYQQLAAGQEDLFQAEWIADYPDAQDFFFNLLNSASIGAENASFYRDRAFDQLEAGADANRDPAARAAAYRALDRLVYRDVPLLPEFYGETAVLVQPWLRPAALGVFLSPPLMPQLERVWVVPHGEAS